MKKHTSIKDAAEYEQMVLRARQDADDYKAACANIQAQAKVEREKYEALEKAFEEEKQKAQAIRTTLEATVADLVEKLRRSESRVGRAIDAANSTAQAASALSRITNNLAYLVDGLESKLALDNKERTRRLR